MARRTTTPLPAAGIALAVGLMTIGLAGLSALATAPAASASTASPGATASNAAGTYLPLPPTRILDTRHSLGAQTPGPGATIMLTVAGHGGVPSSGVGAVAINLTAVKSAAVGDIVAYPAGSSLPEASNLNFDPGQTEANLAIVQLGTGGAIELYNSSAGATPLLGDVVGYWTSGSASAAGAFAPVAATRVLDTFWSLGGTTPGPGATMTVPIGGVGPVPGSGVSAVALNLVAANPAQLGDLSVYPTGTNRPDASSLNFAPRVTVANLVVVPLGTNGEINLYNSSSGSTPVIADVAGYWLSGSSSASGAFVPVTESRALDTLRASAIGTPTGGRTVNLHLAGTNGIPSSGVAAVAVNLTTVNASSVGDIVAYPDETNRPATSSLNFAPNQAIANLAIVQVGADGSVDLFNNSAGSTPLIVDVVGYWLGSPAVAVTSAMPTGCTAMIADRPAAATDLFNTLNSERVQAGLRPFAWDTRLVASARAHNACMAQYNTLSHQLPGEAPIGDRVTAQGVSWTEAAENCGDATDTGGSGDGSSQALMLNTMMYNEGASGGHYQNMMSTSLTYIGVSVVYYDDTIWLTEDFARE